MRGRPVSLVAVSLALAGCDVPVPANRDGAPEPDAYDYRCTEPERDYLSADLVARTPVGSLVKLDYMFARYVTAFCGDMYQVVFTEEPAHECSRLGSLTLSFHVPVDGPLPARGDTMWAHASVTYNDKHAAAYGEQVLQVVHIDSPRAARPRIAGRFVYHDEDWDLDIGIDTVSQELIDCGTGI